jgi:hypothetical protein
MIEKEILASILKLTKQESGVQKEVISRDARVPLEETGKILTKLRKNNLINLRKDMVTANTEQRLKIAIQAINTGADIERICSLLEWKEFEKIVTTALEINSYIIRRNFRFKHEGKAWEIDILGFKQPLILSIDCKHWHHKMSETKTVRIAEAQIERTQNLVNALPSLVNTLQINKGKFAIIPIVVSLTMCTFKFCRGIPIVPVIQLRDFLSQLPAYKNSFTQYTINFEAKNP